MFKIAFNLFISKGFENMFGITKGQWKVVAVAVVVMLGVMYALSNIDALEDVGKKVGLDV
jgi:hypothetical protein